MAELVLGRLKFKWQGNWTAATAYIKDDVVGYGGIAYVAVSNHTSDASNFDVDLTAGRWEQMIGGVEWRNTWSNSTVYRLNDLVKYGPSVYICTENHTSSSTFAANSDKFQLFTSGIVTEGVYDNSTLYQVGDIVTYGAATYICKLESSGNLPSNNTYWTKLVDGQQFEGNYNNAQNYVKGDIVIYGGYGYVATTDTTGNVPTNTQYWAVLFKSLSETGAFSSLITYLPGQIVDYGPWKYIVKQAQTPVVGTKPTNVNFWEIFTKGVSFEGDYDAGTTYLNGQIVKYGGRQYICILETLGNLPTDPVYWELYGRGLEWKGAWDTNDPYKLDDVVEYSGSSYVCIQAHSSGQQPDTATSYWEALAVGDISSPMTTEGDMIYRNAGGAIVRLPVGPSGSFLTVNNGIPAWGHLTPQNDYFVSPQGSDSNDGRTSVTSWRTIRHAAEQTFNLGKARINVMSGTYEEQCPIRLGRGIVLEGNGLGAVDISPNSSRDEGFGVGISDDGSTPNANSYVFLMNNGARIRNLVFRNFSTGSVLVSLDPGYGPDDTSVWITSQSPYVQNCTSFTPGGTGFKIDGSLHNGGYKSMVANDWTQINSDGIGIHVLNDGRTEIVSCFTYYCNIGYLAESGGKIRAIVGNNSYGEYGAVARGFSQSETPLTGNIQLNDDTVDSVKTINGVSLHIFTSYRTSAGEIVCVGHTNPTGTDSTSSWSNTSSVPFIAKFNTDQTVDWLYTYQGFFGAVHSVVELDNSIYAGGVIYEGGSNKGFLIKVSGSGEVQWSKTLGSTDEIIDLTTDGSSYIYALGNNTVQGSTLIRVTPAGIIQWSRTLDYNDSSINTLSGKSLTYAGSPTTSVDTYTLAGDATAEDNIYVAATDDNTGENFIIRVSNAGVLITAYNLGSNFGINKLRLDTGNGDGIYLMVAGYTNPSGTRKPWMARLTVTGTVAWQNEYASGSNAGEFKDVLPFGNDVFASGFINDTDSTQTYNKGFVVQARSTGVLQHEHFVEEDAQNIVFNGVTLDGVNVVTAGNYLNSGVLVNFQRGQTLSTLGTISSGNWTISDANTTVTSNSVATSSIQNVYLQSPALTLTDKTFTLNQQPGITATTEATRVGFASIGNGTTFTFDNLARKPKEGSVLQITGDQETYFVIAVNNFDGNSALVTIDPPIPSNKTPDDNTSIVFREAFSQVRMTGHDFLDIGTGGFADTNYPVIIAEDYAQAPNQERETLSESGGRVFYVTTDQDGNFRVGDYFKVEQSTGRATLSSEEFDLTGLNELQLGSITAGKIGATINEFSTDGTFADNSDTAVPTEKATKTYVDTQLGALSQSSIRVGSNPQETIVEATGTGISTDTIDFDIAGTLRFQVANQRLLVPTGTTAQRPGTPTEGWIRFNTDLDGLEQYTGTTWETVSPIIPDPTLTPAVEDDGLITDVGTPDDAGAITDGTITATDDLGSISTAAAGAAGKLSISTDYSLVVHDGVTLGGFPLMTNTRSNLGITGLKNLTTARAYISSNQVFSSTGTYASGKVSWTERTLPDGSLYSWDSLTSSWKITGSCEDQIFKVTAHVQGTASGTTAIVYSDDAGATWTTITPSTTTLIANQPTVLEWFVTLSSDHLVNIGVITSGTTLQANKCRFIIELIGKS